MALRHQKSIVDEETCRKVWSPEEKSVLLLRMSESLVLIEAMGQISGVTQSF